MSIGTANNADITYTAAGAIIINNNLALQSAGTGYTNTFDMSTYDLTVGSSSVANSGGITVPTQAALTQSASGTTTVSSSDTGSATIGGAGSTTFYNFTLGAASDNLTYTFNLGGAITVSNDLTITDGGTGTHTLDVTASNYGITVGGSWDNNDTFNCQQGTVTFNATTTGKTISDGGSSFYNIVFNGSGGGWTYTDGASTAPNSTTVDAGTVVYLNAKTGTVTVNGGELNVDWYLGVHIVDAANTATNIDTGDSDVTISENSGTPASTVWRHNGTDWGSPAASQTTGTGSDGRNPQPNTAGAIRIREYTQTSAGTTYYLYNLQIAWQGDYGEYDYYADYGGKYLTSTGNTGSGHDEVIGSDWWRTAPNTMNGSPPYSGLNEPPTQGSWYCGMLKGLEVTISGISIDFGTLDSSNDFTVTAGTTTDITVTTSATNGYVVTAWETQLMSCSDAGACGTETIQNFTYGTYADPQPWNTLCKDDNNYCGFGFTSNDPLVEGLNRYNNGTEYTYFPVDASTPVRVMDYSSPVADQSYSITYRISSSATQRPGPYGTTIVYIITAQY